MNVMATAVTAGCTAGLGLLLVATQLVPAPPRLNDALLRLDGRPDQLLDRDAALRGRLAWALRRTSFLLPHRDIELLGTSADTLILKRTGYLLLGTALPPVLNLVAALAGSGLPWTVPAAAGLALGLLFAITPDIAVRREAAERRAEFRAALSSYLDLVALERAAGAGSSEALHAPADICTGWVFTRIHQVLQHARRSGEQPWRGLADLGHKVGVPELVELADIAEDAGSSGAQVLPTLLAKAESMRTAALTTARARANSRTSEMPIAIALSIGGFLLLVCFPAVYRLFLS